MKRKMNKKIDKLDYEQVGQVIDLINDKDRNNVLSHELLLTMIGFIRENNKIELQQALHQSMIEWDIH
jgi:hypothetical protein